MESEINKHLFAVILAGGGGTRLWPRSTTTKPKQFLRLISDKTMLQETYQRILPLVPKERIVVVTNQRYARMVREDLPFLPKENILSEPEKRDSAMAMGLGAIWVKKTDSQGVIINLAADHVVTNKAEFLRTVSVAAQAAQMGDYLVTVGIHPSFPHTGLGYIKIADAFGRVNGMPAFTVDGFTEKPQLATAKAFLATGKYFWNANNYVWTVRAILTAFEKYLPNHFSNLMEILEKLGTKDEKEQLIKSYAKVEAMSIDYGISEKAKNLLLIPGDFGWSDIGDWQVVYDLSKKDANENVVDKSRNEVPILLNSKGCLVNGGKKLLVVVGMEDLVIVETKKALLIISRKKTQEVKEAVNFLKEKKMMAYL